MSGLTVEPPEYYPVIEKLFADGLREALESLGVELLGIKAAVVPRGRELTLAFLLEVSRSETFLPGELDPVVEGVLEDLVERANRTFGKFYDVTFRVAGFRIIERPTGRGKDKPGLVINSPEDLRKTLERLGRGLMIYLKDRKVDFKTLLLTMPSDGRPDLRIVLILSRKSSDVEKDALAENLIDKVSSYLRTLNADYIRPAVRVLDPSDALVGTVLGRLHEIEREAEKLAESEEVRKLIETLGKRPPGN